MTHGFKQRRQAVFSALENHSVMIVASGEETIRNRDVEYPFRVDSDFYYLTGFDEPEAVLVLSKTPKAEKTYLFLRPKDPEQENWQGRRLGVDAAANQLGVDQAWAHEEMIEQVPTLLDGIEQIYFSFAQLGNWSPILEEWIAGQKAKSRKGVTAPNRLSDADGILHEMRLIKSAEEIEWMREAGKITVAGHLAAMKSAVGKATYEYQIQADLEQTFKQEGSPRVAFNSIVASGENACILHYTENSALLKEDALILVDAGAEFKGYAGDITSTFPAGGKFSTEQKALYELTLKAQQAAISVIKPGVRYDEMHQASAKVIIQGLVDLGVLDGEVDHLFESDAYKPFFMHGTGHWLGMDVHDVGAYKQAGEWRALQPGMVVTVEPGIYISPETGRAEGVDPCYWGIGIRIEDDVLVTEDGHEVLTPGLPRTVDEIERFMAEQML